MVESSNQLDMFRQQHAITKDITGHITDPDHGEIFFLNIMSALTEMPLHRDPGTTRSDTHFLVVISNRPTRCEAVAHPEAAIYCDFVGDI